MGILASMLAAAAVHGVIAGLMILAAVFALVGAGRLLYEIVREVIGWFTRRPVQRCCPKCGAPTFYMPGVRQDVCPECFWVGHV